MIGAGDVGAVLVGGDQVVSDALGGHVSGRSTAAAGLTASLVQAGRADGRATVASAAAVRRLFAASSSGISTATSLLRVWVVRERAFAARVDFR